MTLGDATALFDAQRANDIALSLKISWINELEMKISSDFLEARKNEPFKGYDTSTALNTKLLAPDEYGEIYALYMIMKLDFVNGEIARYNNSASLFSRLYREMGDYINRKEKVSNNSKIKAGKLYV